jgi:hypothetical protein
MGGIGTKMILARMTNLWLKWYSHQRVTDTPPPNDTKPYSTPNTHSLTSIFFVYVPGPSQLILPQILYKVARVIFLEILCFGAQHPAWKIIKATT